MSQTTSSPRVRVNPRRAPPAQPIRRAPWPWNDGSGRFSGLKAVSLLAILLPGAWIAFALATHRYGARPITEAIHQTGYWAVRFLLLSLLVSPVRAIFNWPRVMLVRRQLGLAALAYAVLHVVLYAWDEAWKWSHVASEILLRFYLEVGLVALVGLAVLGVSSTGHARRQLGRGWQRLHQLVYPVAALGLFHFFLQSKADAGQAVLMAGLFAWLIGWRLIPAGPDRAPGMSVALAMAAGLGALAIEVAWYGLATNIGFVRPAIGELNVAYGPQSAGQVLLVCLCMATATALFWAQLRARWHHTLPFHIGLYGGAAVIAAVLAFAFSLTDDWLPPDWSFWQAAGGFVAAALALGLVRWLLPPGAVSRRVLDALCLLFAAAPIAAGMIT